MAGAEAGGTSRSEFLRRTAGVTGLVVGAGLWTRQAQGARLEDPVVSPDAAATAATGSRAYVASHFALELDNKAIVGFMRSVEGGGIKADVILEKATETLYYQRKHIGNPKYEDFTLEVDFGFEKTFFDWISASFQGTFARKNGAVVITDNQFAARARREFTDALISEVTFPAMDGSSKDAAFMTINITPETTRNTAGSGSKTTAPTTKQKQWLAANFKLEIDGLDTTRVSKIDSFTIKQGLVTRQIGDVRDYQVEPGKLDFPDLHITLTEQSSQSWYDWFDDFVIKGNNGQEQERNGRLTFLAPNLNDELGEVRFYNLGIFRLTPDYSDTIRRVNAELYCERMEFSLQPLPPPPPNA